MLCRLLIDMPAGIPLLVIASVEVELKTGIEGPRSLCPSV